MAKTKKIRSSSITSGRTKKLRTRSKARVTLRYQKKSVQYDVPLKLLKKLDQELEAYKVEEDQTVPIDNVLKSLDDGRPDWAVHFKGLRQRENLTQQQMAKKLSITQGNVSEYEHGKRQIGKNMAKRIARVFHIDYRLFL